MGVLKKTRSTQKPPGYLTPNITDDLGGIRLDNKLKINFKKNKASSEKLGAIVLSNQNTKEIFSDTNIFGEKAIINKEELSNKPDENIISTNDLYEIDEELGKIEFEIQDNDNTVKGDVYTNPIDTEVTTNLDEINTDSSFVTNISKDMGITSVQLEAGEFTGNIVAELKNETIISSNYIKGGSLSGIVFENPENDNNAVTEIKDSVITTGEMKNAVTLQETTINTEGKTDDNIMVNTEVLYEVKPEIQHSVKGDVYINPENDNKTVDGSVYNNIKPKSGEISKLGDISLNETKERSELLEETIVTESSKSNKNETETELGILNDFVNSDKTKDILTSSELYKNNNSVKEIRDLGLLKFENLKIGNNILDEHKLYDTNYNKNKTLEQSNIIINTESKDKKELDRNDATINSGKSTKKDVETLETIRVEDNKTKIKVIKDLGSIY